MYINWVDIVIVVLVLYYVYSGWERGFTALVGQLLSFLASLWLAVRYHGPLGAFITQSFGVAVGWAKVLGYISIAFLSQVVLEELFMAIIHKLPAGYHQSKVNKVLGSLLSAINGVILITFILLIIVIFPLRGSIKQDVRNSSLAKTLITLAEQYAGPATSSLEDAASYAIKFLTVQPGTKESIPIDIPANGVTFRVDPQSEAAMVSLVNQERIKVGLKPLEIDPKIVEVSRGKSRDMFDRRYFSHYDPDGHNAADRMNTASVPFTLVGENLAYAPDVQSAHTGLMESQGHRENILEPRFRRIGIGAIDGGLYGVMFTQIFAD